MPSLKVDPQKVTDFNRSRAQLEALLLFSVAVAGKTASQISKALERFLAGYRGSPFTRVRRMIEEGVLEQRIKDSKLGKHRVLAKAYRQLSELGLDLRTCSADDLEQVCGIGLKTSRFFLLHSRKNAQVAALDTHILKYLREVLKQDAPSQTPVSAKKYRMFEETFLRHAAELGRDSAELDLEIWNTYSRGGNRYQSGLKTVGTGF